MIEKLQILRTVPQAIAYIPIKVPREDVRTVMGPGLAEVRAALAEQGAAAAGPWFTHHFRAPGAMFDFEICVPVAAAITPSGRVRAGEWAATDVARTTYHGGFEGLGAAWGAFMEAILDEGRKTGDDLWERYLVGPEAGADPAAWRTELSKPLA